MQPFDETHGLIARLRLELLAQLVGKAPIHAERVGPLAECSVTVSTGTRRGTSLLVWYDRPHFDFHFYTVPIEVRNAIVPTDPQYSAKAASFPSAEFRVPFYIDAATPSGVPAALATVPQMGLHWLDVRSPELQKIAGHPELWQPFTKTFIYGSWGGQFIFDEPMITRDYIMSKRQATGAAVRDEIIPVPTAPRYAPAGYYPSAYRITYDAEAKEYRVALTQLAWRN